MSPTIVTLMGCTAPAPMPWIARNRMSVGMLHAMPHSMDPRRNTAMPKNITGLRPKTSASLP